MGSEDDLVEIHPRELRFLFEVKKQSSCSVHLANRSDQYVAFKIKTTSPKRYCVRPNVGVILPRASCHFVVTMQAQKNAPPDLQIKDKFLVQTTVVPFGTADEDIVRAFFSKETGRYIEENKLRVVLVSTTQPQEPQEEQLITGVAHAKSTVEVPVAEKILDNMNEVPNVVNEVHQPLKASYPHLRETPAILSDIPSPVKERPTVLRDFLVPSKESPFTLTESAPSLKETSAVSVGSLYSSTETSATLNESPPLKDTPAPREFAILSDKGPANAENLHLSHITEDVQNLQSKLNNLEAKLEEAETLIVKLREETRTTIQERDKLRKEMVFFKRAGTARSQAGFPLLFVVYMAVVGMSLGYILHL
ncbi:vesicle-associated protein 2-2-like isoform X2 [Phragmites australis]|uniref:vesicle-associated protein 2-2-like isoform X2 n=1 Tax=Phragmites australis TaxID=29695 RepID=UPI002D7A2E6D|nr:vesicle-associated protein 2-2-like isoform X2 [Phragmites australis]